MRGHDFKGREDVVTHLADEHGWEDRPYIAEPFGEMAKYSLMRTAGGEWLIQTSEYMAIHRELELARPRLIVSEAQLDEPGRPRVF